MPPITSRDEVQTAHACANLLRDALYLALCGDRTMTTAHLELAHWHLDGLVAAMGYTLTPVSGPVHTAEALHYDAGQLAGEMREGV